MFGLKRKHNIISNKVMLISKTDRTTAFEIQGRLPALIIESAVSIQSLGRTKHDIARWRVGLDNTTHNFLATQLLEQSDV